MSGIEQFLSSPAGMIATLFVGLILVLVIVLAALGRRDKIMSERLDDVEEALMKQMGSNRDQSDVQSQRNREELTHNLRGMSDSVTRVMNEMARHPAGPTGFVFRPAAHHEPHRRGAHGWHAPIGGAKAGWL